MKLAAFACLTLAATAQAQSPSVLDSAAVEFTIPEYAREVRHALGLLGSGKPHEAVPLLQRMARQNPLDPYLANALANALERDGGLQYAPPIR